MSARSQACERARVVGEFLARHEAAHAPSSSSSVDWLTSARARRPRRRIAEHRHQRPGSARHGARQVLGPKIASLDCSTIVARSLFFDSLLPEEAIRLLDVVRHVVERLGG